MKIKNNRLSTPLHYTDSEACALMLIDAGADINAVNIERTITIEIRDSLKRPAVERLLRRFKARDIGP